MHIKVKVLYHWLITTFSLGLYSIVTDGFDCSYLPSGFVSLSLLNFFLFLYCPLFPSFIPDVPPFSGVSSFSSRVWNTPFEEGDHLVCLTCFKYVLQKSFQMVHYVRWTRNKIHQIQMQKIMQDYYIVRRKTRLLSLHGLFLIRRNTVLTLALNILLFMNREIALKIRTFVFRVQINLLWSRHYYNYCEVHSPYRSNNNNNYLMSV